MKITLIADVHVNSKNLKHHKSVLDEVIKKASGDYLIIAGDYFDKEENFEKDLEKIMLLQPFTKKFKKVFLIKGTDSHDNTLGQKHLSASKLICIEYIETATSIELEDKKILFLPEEYPINREKFYSKFFNQNYDIVVGHGNIIGAKTTTGYVLTPQEYKLKGFYANDLSKIAKFTFFGHIHNHQMLSDNVGYIGSLTKNNFADTDKKGFIEIDLKENKYSFIEITSNKDYLTFNINEVNWNLVETLIEKAYIRIILDNKSQLNLIPFHIKDKIKVLIKENHFENIEKNLNTNFAQNVEELLQNPFNAFSNRIDTDKTLSKKKKKLLKSYLKRELNEEKFTV